MKKKKTKTNPKCTFSSVYLTQAPFVVCRTPISCVGDIILLGKATWDALTFQYLHSCPISNCISPSPLHRSLRAI